MVATELNMTIEMQQSQHQTILTVDDDPMFLLMMRQFLEKEGYQVEQADNGKSALASFHQHQPSCVLMDVSMPEMDGLEACKAIKKHCKETDIPVIMVTAQETDEAVDRCYDVGASDYIKKPIHWAVLRNRVHNLIEQSIANSRIKESEEKLS